MQTNKDYILTQIKEIIKQRAPEAKVYLYGSRSRGTSKKHSDWDLLILLNKDHISHDTEQQITSPLYDLEFNTGEIISPMIYSQQEWYNKYRQTPYFKNVMRDGTLL
jgi:predicted nucleotidyltransferase